MKTEIFSLGFRKITGPHVKTMERRLHPSWSMRNASGIWRMILSPILILLILTPVFVRLYEKPEFLKRCVLGERFRWIRVDGRPNRRKNLRFQKQKRIHVDRTYRWCYTRQFATTIFNATQRCNVGTMLELFETMSQQYCKVLLR